MKKTFPGHFPPTKKDLDRLWESCLFTLDTNILLNFYRYSDATRNEFIRILKAIKDRLWLPHRAAQEYFENRLSVISQQEKAYEEAIKTIQILQDDLSNARQHPFLSDKLMKKLTQVLGEVVEELTTTKTTHASRISSDEIEKAIGDLFNGRVGAPYSDDRLEVIYKEGEGRYAKKIPPGYKDDGKGQETSSVAANSRKYGDLIIWHQIIDHATEVKKPVIFINDDKKEDWWLVFRGKNLGPRPELIEEFLNEASQSFYMYQADRFLKYAADHLKQTITPESMDEIRDLRERDLDKHAELLRRREEEVRLREYELRIRSEVLQRRAHLAYLRDKANQLMHGQAIYQEKLDGSRGEDHDSLEGYLELQASATAAEREMAQVHEELKAMEREYAITQQMLAELQRITKRRLET